MSSNPYSDMGGGNPYQPSQFAPSFGTPGGDREAARAKIQTPAIALMVFAIVFAVILLLLLMLNMLGIGLIAAAAPNNPEGAQAMGQGVIGMASSVIGLIVSGVIVFGAIKMKNLESRGLAMTAAVLAALPVISPCCLVGLPIGIWCINTMNDPVVKAVYH